MYLDACQAVNDHSGSTGYQEKRQQLIDAQKEAFEATFQAGDMSGKYRRKLDSLDDEDDLTEEKINKIQKYQKKLNKVLESKEELLQKQNLSHASLAHFIQEERALQERKNEAYERMQELFSKSDALVSRVHKRQRTGTRPPPHPIQNLLDPHKQTHLLRLSRKYKHLGLDVTVNTVEKFIKSFWDQEWPDNQKEKFTQEDLVKLMEKMENFSTEKAEGKEVTWQYLLQKFSEENPPKRRTEKEVGNGDVSANTLNDRDAVEEEEPAKDPK